MSPSLHDRIAKALGWKLEDTYSLSLLMLRELLRDSDPALAREITEGVRSGSYIVQPAPPPPLWHAVETLRTVKGERYRIVGSFKARSKEEAEAITTSRWPGYGFDTRSAYDMARTEGVQVYDPHREPSKKLTKVKAARSPHLRRTGETYLAARKRLLSELGALGWTVRPELKFPWAKHPNHDFRVNFKAQAVYLNDHSLWIDIRGMSTEEFVKNVAHAANRRGR